MSEKTLEKTNKKISEESFWLQKLKGEIQASIFPPDLIELNKKREIETLNFIMSDENTQRLMKLSNDSEYRLFMILLSGVFLLINKYLDSEDIIIGTSVTRQKEETDFINTILCLRHQISLSDSYKDLIIKIKDVLIEATQNQNYPVETLPYKLNLPANSDKFQLFNCAVLLDSIHDEKYIGHLNLDLIFKFIKNENGINCEIKYNKSIYSQFTIETIFKYYNQLIDNALNDIDCPVCDINLYSESDKNKVINEFNDTYKDFPLNKTVKELFETSVANNSDRIALIYGDQQITYRELNLKASHLSQKLIENGIGTDCVVGLLVDRSIEMIIGLLGILKSGGIYLPIDPTYPEMRKQYIIEDSGCKILLVNKDLANSQSESALGCDYFIIDDIINASSEKEEFTNHLEINSDNFLYIIYTSGSTGKPKGVLIKNEGIVNLIYNYKEAFNQNHNSRNSQVSSISFDAMAFEIWPCLVSGASLNIVEDETRLNPINMKNWVIKNQITNSYQPTVIFEQLIKLDWEKSSLNILKAAGDKMNILPSKKMPFKMFNLYGPTEDSVWTTYFELQYSENNNEKPSIGKPINNKKVFIYGKENDIKPVGVFGELAISGSGISSGYVNNPELTHEKFISNTNCTIGKIYKTGDKARWLPDGNIDFSARIDHQVKIRGFRIELGEIQNVSIKMEGVVDVITKIHTSDTGKYICIYFTANRQIKSSEFKTFLANYLPDYMIPSYFIQMDNLPLTSNGKYDYYNLPSPDINVNNEYETPVGAIEKKLVQIWSEVLNIPQTNISRNASFFNLGGHSILVTTMAQQITKELNVQISLTDIFQAQTLKELAERIEKGLKKEYLPIPQLPEQEYYEASHAQKRLWVLEQLQTNNSALNIQNAFLINFDFNVQIFEETLKYLSNRHENLRTTFHNIDDSLMQKIHDPGKLEIKIDYLNLTESIEYKSEIKDILTEDTLTRFDLEKDALMRVKLIKFLDDKYLMVLNTHHIISDAISMKILQDEFTIVYNAFNNNEEVELGTIEKHYKDYANWHNAKIKNGDFDEAKRYWMEMFKDIPPVLDLQIENNDQKTNDISFVGSNIINTIDKKVLFSLKEISTENQCTLYATLLSAVYTLLHYYSQQDEIVIGIPADGRDHYELMNQVGFFINVLPLKVSTEEVIGFNDILNQVKSGTMNLLQYKSYPYDVLVKDLGIESKGDSNSLFRVVSQLIHADYVQEEDLQEEFQNEYGVELNTSKYDLTITFTVIQDSIKVQFNHKTGVFNNDSIEAFSNRFTKLLDIITDDVKFNIADLDLEETILLPSFD